MCTPSQRLFAAWQWVLSIGLAVGLFHSPPTTRAQTFVDATAEAMIDHVQWENPIDDRPEALRITGGAAAGDYDNDGWVDLFVTRFEQADILYRNLGNGTFEDVSTEAGFVQSLRSNGATWGDVDNDGNPDLFVTTVSDPSQRYYLYMNDGMGHFTEQAIPRGAALNSFTEHKGTSATFGDYDRDGYLDLYVAEWGGEDSNNPSAVQSHNRLLRNSGTFSPGNFEDRTLAAGVSIDLVPAVTGKSEIVGTYAFAPSFSDMDSDGYPDLAIVGDFQTSRLFWNRRNGTFQDGTIDAGVGTDENGMGSAIGDYDGDGNLDWFVTSIFDPDDICADTTCVWGTTGNRLYRNEGGRAFADATDDAGIRDGDWGWAAAWLDYDNDTDLDLIMTNGVDFSGTFDDPFNHDPMHLWQNQQNGQFVETSAAEGIVDTGSGKGLLTLDYDNDGDVDVFVVNHGAQPILYKNQTDGAKSWLQINVVGVVSNRDGLGARIMVDPDLHDPNDQMMVEINAASHYLGQSDSRAHFGLGDHSNSLDQVTIQWPSGAVQVLENLDSNQRHVIIEPTGGDLDANGNVDGNDLHLLLQQWDQQVPTFSWLHGDASGDGRVGQNDLNILLTHWHHSLLPVSTVPEPMSAIICISSIMSVAACRPPRKLSC